MSSNSTDDWQNLPYYLLYSFQGVIISGSNLLIVFSIVRYEALRTSKEYLIMLGLSLTDSCFTSGFAAAGTYRTMLLITGQHSDLLSPWQCATKLHNILLTIGSSCDTMLVGLSLDRLLCVSYPLEYIGWTCKYAYGIFLASFASGLAYCGIYLFVAYSLDGEAAKMPAPCVTYDAIRGAPRNFQLAFQLGPPLFALLSVIIYIFVWYKYKKYFSEVVPLADGNQSLQQQQIQHQRRITVSLGISCLCTVALLCIPLVLASVMLKLGYIRVAFFSYFIVTFNPLCNVFIYQIRHRELRVALKGFLSCRNMPNDIRMWNVNQNARTGNPEH